MLAYGHVPDHPARVAEDLRLRRAGTLLGTTPSSIPDHGDILSACAPVRDQTGNCCVGEWSARSIHTRGQILHAADASVPAIPYPSPIALWTIVRMEGANGQPLVDEGISPSALVASAKQFGAVRLDRWDPDAAHINDPVPQDVFEAGADALVTGSYRIDEGDGDIPTRLVQAMLAGYMPGYGQPVDDAYENLGASGIYDGPRSKLLGNHMQAICGWDFRGPLPFFLVMGSWGVGFADSGIAKVSARFLASAACFDRLVITTAPARLS